MGFLDKVKRGLNIGGAKVLVQIPSSVANGANLDTKVTVQGGSLEQTIVGLHIEVIQEENWVEYANGQRQSRVRNLTLNSKDLPDSFSLKPGEQREFTLSLLVQTAVASAAQTGVIGALNKFSTTMQQRQYIWKVVATAKVPGSVDPHGTANFIVQS